ncbi:MinD/ParA family protein [Clostridium chrysemydis]|uniref:MinD/ParA family protein n=1 Tax=Clostridium chrysemydis TaxID=2665504 RepID=UPI003F4020FE
MLDQAESLRRMVQRKVKIVTITSGKGGVGKSNFVVNLGITLQKSGKKVLIFDADIGMGNDDVLMGVYPKYNIFHVIKGMDMKDIIVKGPEGVSLVAAGSGINAIEDLKEEERRIFLNRLKDLEGYDYILIDTGAGINRSVLAFIACSEEVIVVTTPEPTSMTDAYSLLKAVNHFELINEANIVVNMTLDSSEGKNTFEKMKNVVEKFLSLKVNYLGEIPEDLKLVQSVRSQKPFVLLHPKSKSSKALESISNKFVNEGKIGEETVKGLFSKLFNIFS